MGFTVPAYSHFPTPCCTFATEGKRFTRTRDEREKRQPASAPPPFLPSFSSIQLPLHRSTPSLIPNVNSLKSGLEIITNELVRSGNNRPVDGWRHYALWLDDIRQMLEIWDKKEEIRGGWVGVKALQVLLASVPMRQTIK